MLPAQLACRNLWLRQEGTTNRHATQMKHSHAMNSAWACAPTATRKEKCADVLSPARLGVAQVFPSRVQKRSGQQAEFHTLGHLDAWRTPVDPASTRQSSMQRNRTMLCQSLCRQFKHHVIPARQKDRVYDPRSVPSLCALSLAKKARVAHAGHRHSSRHRSTHVNDRCASRLWPQPRRRDASARRDTVKLCSGRESLRSRPLLNDDSCTGEVTAHLQL